MVLIIAITGASGAIYGIRLLEVLKQAGDVETHLVISEAAARTIEYETTYTVAGVMKLAHHCYDNKDVGAALASGSFRRDGMVVMPCSVKTMGALAHSYSENLIIRAGDVTLKERKRLVLVVRETPLHLGHLRNMVQLTEMGAVILPPVTNFYSKPKTIDDLINHIVGRTLDLFGIDHSLVKRWKGEG
ncbi:MAG: UbiX family flavin prenyltransferase [Chloroflexi bacterium]|nr:UbiX family flavin prenyltransferase [Chloroflexota bacterium]